MNTVRPVDSLTFESSPRNFLQNRNQSFVNLNTQKPGDRLNKKTTSLANMATNAQVVK